MVRSFTITLTAAPTQLSSVYGPGPVNQALNIPYRQLLFTSATADAFLGDSTLGTTSTGLKVASAGNLPPVSIGSFDTGPLKLSDIYAMGAGSVLQILGVPF